MDQSKHEGEVTPQLLMAILGIEDLTLCSRGYGLHRAVGTECRRLI